MKGQAMKAINKIILFFLAAIGFIAVYAMVDIIYGINLLTPVWYMQNLTGGWFGKIAAWTIAFYIANKFHNFIMLWVSKNAAK
jgi:hypothetical protein